MAGNIRQWAKDKLKSAVSHLDTAGQYLQEIITVYQEQHPEISEGCELAQEGIAASMVTINTIDEGI
jgi:hypothetical protein